MNQQSKSGKNSSSALPLVIIGVVLVAVLGGAWWLYNRNTTATKTNNGATNKPTANKTASTPVTTNLMGAQPPNMLGSPNATVTVEEFADFQCPTCGMMHPKMKELTSIYGSRIKFIFRNYPLQIPAHDKAYEAAVAAEAAGLQGKFWDMQNLLFRISRLGQLIPNTAKFGKNTQAKSVSTLKNSKRYGRFERQIAG